jgi:hypothetical protein
MITSRRANLVTSAVVTCAVHTRHARDSSWSFLTSDAFTCEIGVLLPNTPHLQGYLAHKKPPPPPRTTVGS